MRGRFQEKKTPHTYHDVFIAVADGRQKCAVRIALRSTEEHTEVCADEQSKFKES